MCVVQQRKMENTQNTIPDIRLVGGELQATTPKKAKVAKEIQPMATTAPKTKNPKRVASGKRLAEHNRRKREEQQQQEENSLSSQLSSIPNIVSVGTLLLAAYTVYSNRKPTQQQQQYTTSNPLQPQQPQQPQQQPRQQQQQQQQNESIRDM